MGTINIDTNLAAIATGQPRDAAPIANSLSTIQTLVNGNIEAANIATDAIGNSELADDAVYTANIKDWVNGQAYGVTTAKIADDAITIAKVAPVSGTIAATSLTTAAELATNGTRSGTATASYTSANGETILVIGEAEVYTNVADGLVTDGRYKVQVQYSTDGGSTWTDCAGSQLTYACPGINAASRYYGANVTGYITTVAGTSYVFKTVITALARPVLNTTIRCKPIVLVG